MKIIGKNTRRNNDVDETDFVSDLNRLFYVLILVGIVGVSLMLGIMYLVGKAQPSYTYHEGNFNLKVTEDVNRYVKNTDVTTYGIQNVEPTKSGIEDLIGTYRKPLYKSMGSDGVEKLSKLNYMSVYEVNDDGKDVDVLVYLNEKVRLGYDEMEKGTSTLRFVDMADMEKDRLLMATAYAFKDSRNVHVQFGNMTKNEYNEVVFAGISGNEYVFHMNDLRRIKDWKTYSVDKLKGLNKL